MYRGKDEREWQSTEEKKQKNAEVIAIKKVQLRSIEHANHADDYAGTLRSTTP